MSSAPRPQTQPSRSSPDHGSTVHSSGSASTVSTWPRRHSARPVGARRAGGRPGWAGPATAASSSHSKPALLEQVPQELLRGLLVARRVDRVEADQPLQQLGRAALEFARSGTRSSIWSRHAAPSTAESRDGAALRPRGHRAARGRTGVPPAEPAAGRAHAPALARRVRGPGAPARPRLRAAHGDRGGPAALDDPLRAARAPARPRSRACWPCTRSAAFEEAVGRERRPRRGARGDRARGGAALHGRRAHDLLPRRDPPLQQGAAGHAAARGGGGPRVAGGRHHREPVLRGELGAPLALPRCTSCTRSTTSTCWRCCGARSATSAASPTRRAVEDDALEFLAARSGGDARTALARARAGVRHGGPRGR